MICAQKIYLYLLVHKKNMTPLLQLAPPPPYPILVIIDQSLIPSNHAIWISMHAHYASCEFSLCLPVAIVFCFLYLSGIVRLCAHGVVSERFDSESLRKAPDFLIHFEQNQNKPRLDKS